uniref:Uncharacterized protein n=1 Tax=Tanacetum cinerariifolium TaxID=118510 RepID=A0A6L2KUE4_TANCI|nr:hypothetical protein [Tanacetum cinerariifolium]
MKKRSGENIYKIRVIINEITPTLLIQVHKKSGSIVGSAKTSFVGGKKLRLSKLGSASDVQRGGIIGLQLGYLGGILRLDNTLNCETESAWPVGYIEGSRRDCSRWDRPKLHFYRPS